MGFKTFQNNNTLTAEDVNDFLMEQAVQQYADASARTAALPNPQEGMVSYLNSTDAMYFWNGSTWIELAATTLSGQTLRQTVVCTSTTRPSHAAGRRIFETDTGREYLSNGTVWRRQMGVRQTLATTGVSAATGTNVGAGAGSNQWAGADFTVPTGEVWPVRAYFSAAWATTAGTGNTAGFVTLRSGTDEHAKLRVHNDGVSARVDFISQTGMVLWLGAGTYTPNVRLDSDAGSATTCILRHIVAAFEVA